MRALRNFLASALMCGTLVAGAQVASFAQGKDQKKDPPKQEKVVPKEEKQPKNNDQQRNNNDQHRDSNSNKKPPFSFF
jgi:uncharacterized membrane protein YebE (DUF533 family)